MRISGKNARRSLFGTPGPAHRSARAPGQDPISDWPTYHGFLRRLRHGVGACGALWLLLDRHGSHCSPSSLRLAQKLGIRLLWLPRQHPKLNPVDHLWRGLKNTLAANRQFASIEELASYAESWGACPHAYPDPAQSRPALAKMLAQETTQDTLAFYLDILEANRDF